MQPAEDGDRSDRAGEPGSDAFNRDRDLLTDPLVRPSHVEVAQGVFSEDMLQMCLSKDHDPIEAFASDTPKKSFAHRIHQGRLTRREATMSCCRRSAFSAISSVRERVRSAMKPPATLEGRHALRSALIARAPRPATVAASREPGTRSTARSERIRRRSSSLVPQRILSDRVAEEERSQDS